MDALFLSVGSNATAAAHLRAANAANARYVLHAANAAAHLHAANAAAHLRATNAAAHLPPAAAEKKVPVVVYFHGGGFMIGSAGSAAYHRCLNDLAAACPAVAVSVDYRLAPEHPVPAAYEDSLAALKWVLSASDAWLATHGDPGRVFLAGDSAGANICHHLAMHPDIRDAGLNGVVLIHPWFWGKDPIGGEPRSPSKQKQQKSRKVMVCVAEGEVVYANSGHNEVGSHDNTPQLISFVCAE